MNNCFQQKVPSTTREELRAITDRAVGIRKQMSQAQQQGSRGAGEMEDASRIAEMIEKLSRFGQGCDAETALEILSKVEILISLLEAEF